MLDEEFARGNSLPHRRDPKVKIIVAAIFTVVVAVSDNFGTVTLALSLALILLLLSRVQLRPVVKRLLAANSFTVFLWLTLPFTYSKEIVTALGPLVVSDAGLRLAALITLKTNTIICGLIALLATSRIADLSHALEGLHLPRRLCHILFFSYRYIFVIHQEYQRLHRAARMRCFRPASTLHTYRTYSYLFGMTLVKSWIRASRVYQAMILRGFNGQLIPLEQQTVARADLLFLAISLVCMVVIVMTAIKLPNIFS